jgi:hypothetical protein
MPPHCDSLDGPVVTAAANALEGNDARLVLPFVPKAAEAEVTEAFEAVTAARALGPEAKQVADRYLFETVVRIHRAGEGAPYTGLKPAGLDVGPVIGVAEQAIAEGVPDALVELLSGELEREIRGRFAEMLRRQARADGDVDATRDYVEAMLGLQVWAHSLHESIHGDPHEHTNEHHLTE